MSKNLEKLSAKELMEMYTKNREFINYLDKEYANIEKMRDDK